MTDKEALQIAYNALVEIDKQTPYPIAKHAIQVINKAFNTAQDIESAILAEREACAKLCESPIATEFGKGIAAAIRARGDKHE